MKYIIGQLAGKQFLFKKNEFYDIDFIKNAKIGDFITFKKILLYKNFNKIQLGNPFLINSQIFAKVIQHIKYPKVAILKTKPKKNYTRIKSYRYFCTRIQIINLNFQV